MAIERVARIAHQGLIAGIDFSDQMVKRATARNAVAISARQVELKAGHASVLPYADDFFDKVFSTNVIYFWENPVSVLKEMRRVLKTDGRIAQYFVGKEGLMRPFGETGVFSLYTGEEVAGLFAEAQFKQVRIETKKERKGTGICVLGEK